MKKFIVCLEPGCLELTGYQDQEKCPKHRPSPHFRMAFHCADCGAYWYGSGKLCSPCLYRAKEESFQGLKAHYEAMQRELAEYRSLGTLSQLTDKLCRLDIFLHAEELQLE